MNLQAILEDQNPWWRKPEVRVAERYPVRRDLQGHLLERLLDLGDRRAAVVLGPRQVGKTTLLLQLVDDLLDGGWPAPNLVYFDFSDDRVIEGTTAREVVEEQPVGVDPSRPRVLLLDEVRLAPNWDRWLKQAVDRGGHRIAVTDSAASLLRDAGRESGQGRWDEHRLEGLSFRELVRLLAPGEEVESAAARLPGLFERYLTSGGFPEHAASDDPIRIRQRLRSDVVERAILRDLAPAVESAAPVRDLFVYLMQRSGAIFNASGAGGELGRDERSIRRWVELLEETFLLVSLPRRTARSSSRLKPRPKLYAADPGLVSAFAAAPWREDAEHRGRLFEAAVFRHLRDLAREHDGELSYFRPRQDKEVDFVLDGPAGVTAIEVTASTRLKPAKVARLKSAARELGAGRTVLVHGGLVEEEAAGVAAVPLPSFLRDPAGRLFGEGDGGGRR